MRFFRNDTGNPDAYYEPNSFGGPKQDPAVAEPPLHISGDAARYDHHEGNDDFSQPGALFRLFDADQKKRLFSNISAAMQEFKPGREEPELKALVVEASQALARLDRGRLEELSVSCEALNRNLPALTAAGRGELARQAREAVEDLAVFARVLDATRANLKVMGRLRELRTIRLEYSERQVSGWGGPESGHGNH